MITSKQIRAKIATFSTNRAKLQVLGHEIAMMIVNHAAPIGAGPNACGTNDCSLAIKLAKEMPKSWQAQLELWFKTFTPIRVIVKNDKCEYDPAYKKLTTADERLTAWRIGDAQATPFYELSEEPDVEKSYTFEELVKMFQSLGTRIKNKIDNGEVKEEDVADAKEMSDRLSKITFTRKPKTVKAANDTAAKTKAKPAKAS